MLRYKGGLHYKNTYIPLLDREMRHYAWVHAFDDGSVRGEYFNGTMAQHRPQELSGGQRQRVAVARAIVMEPSLILADEPTGNLDTGSGSQVIELLERLRSETGITLIIVTHDMELGGRAQRQIKIVDGMLADDRTV